MAGKLLVLTGFPKFVCRRGGNGVQWDPERRVDIGARVSRHYFLYKGVRL